MWLPLCDSVSTLGLGYDHAAIEITMLQDQLDEFGKDGAGEYQQHALGPAGQRGIYRSH